MILLGTRQYRALTSQLAELQATVRAMQQQVLDLGIAAAAKFEVCEIFDDYNLCRNFDANGEGGLVPVLRPFDLMATGWDGESRPDHDGTLHSYSYSGSQTRTKTVVSSGEEETQNIVPRYVPRQTVTATEYPGSIITAVLLIGGSGHLVGGDPQLDADDAPITWIEVGPRAWSLANE